MKICLAGIGIGVGAVGKLEVVLLVDIESILRSDWDLREYMVAVIAAPAPALAAAMTANVVLDMMGQEEDSL